MDPSRAADHRVTSKPTAQGATSSAKDSQPTGKDSLGKTISHAARASFDSPVRKVIWGLLSATAVILGIVIPVHGFLNHESQISLEAKWLSVSNPEFFQSTFALSPSNATANSPKSEIRWDTVYSITNSGNQVISLKDISLDFPRDHTPTGQSVQLKRTQASQSMMVYTGGYTDWEKVHSIKNAIQQSNEEFFRTSNRPILLEAGQTYYVQYDQQFAFKVNGKAVNFAGEPALAYILGQYFRLARNPNGTFKCGSAEIPTSIETTNGTMQKLVTYEILFPGCTVNIP